MEVIKSKISDSKKVIKLIVEYFEVLLPLTKDHYEEDISELRKMIKEYPNLQNNIDKKIQLMEDILKKPNNDENTIGNIFDLYHEFQNLNLSLKNICDFLNQPHLHAENIEMSNLSQTYKLETADFLSKIVLQYNNLNKKHLDNNTIIITYLSDITLDLIIKSKDIMKLFTFIQKQFRNNLNTVHLYSYIIQKLIDYLSDQKYELKQIMYKIMDQIEYDKDYFMIHNINEKPFKTKYSNPMIKRFGLIPVTLSTELSDIIPIMLNKSITGKIDFKSIAKSENCCIIVMQNCTYTPIEYNVQPLLMKHIAGKTLQPINYGINDKIIERFQTIKEVLDSKGKKSEAKWEFSYEIYGDKESSKYYILETINSKKYRILSPWMFSRSYAIPSHKIKPIVTYLENPYIPSRVSSYQNNSIKQSLKKMFVSKPLDLSSIDEHSKEMDAQGIKTELFLKINSVIKDIIKSEYANGKKLKTNAEINDVIHDSRISDTFSSTLLKMYNIGFKTLDAREFDAGKFPFYELLSSYILDLRDSNRKFMKDLHDTYNRDPINKDILEKNDMSMINQKIEQVLTAAITNQINDKNNIYQSLNYKYLLLNFH